MVLNAMARGEDCADAGPVRLAEAVKPRRIGLVVDHPLRDLDGLCLVAQMLAERGHEAVLLPFYAQHFDLPNLDLDALVLNYARPANLPLARSAIARGVAVCVLDTEGGLIPEEGPTSAGGMAKFLRQSGLDAELSLYLFWGERLRSHITDNTALPPERAILTGCPRFDLARARSGCAEDAKRRAVLVNTNFPVVNPAHAAGAQVDVEALRSIGFQERDIANLAHNVRAVMQRMIETVHALAKARPNRDFVVRPHPFERIEPYERAFADCPNVTVRREGTAMEALEQSACLLHVNCTTAIEACLVGVPPISLDFINAPMLRDMARLPSEISHPVQSVWQTLSLIDRAHKLAPSPAHETIAPFFGPLDGMAAERVVDALATAPLYRGQGRSHSARFDPKPLLGRLLGSRVIESVRSAFHTSRRIKAFGIAEVRDRIERIARDRRTSPAILDHSRSALGLPIMAVNVRPPRLR